MIKIKNKGENMKKILSLITIVVLLVSQFTMSFAGAYDREINFTKSLKVNNDNRYIKPSWVGEEYREKKLKLLLDESAKNGYLTVTEKATLNNMLDEYIKMFNESTEYVYATEDGIPEAYKDGIAKYLYRSNPTGPDFRMFKDGKQIFICYTIEHIESTMNLMTYGLINENDRVLDLNGVPSRSDGVVMAVKMLGGEKEALEGKISSPYIGVPEYAKAYVAYANKVGILESVPDGTQWDDSVLNLEEYGAMLVRVLDYKVADIEYIGSGEYLVDGKKVAQKDLNAKSYENAYLDLPSMYQRLGTYYDAVSTFNKLQAGEPLRNGDMISLADKMLYETKSKSNVRLIDELTNKKIISKDLRRYMENKKYYEKFTDVPGNRPDDVSDFTKMLYSYEMDDSDIRCYSIIANYDKFYHKKENQIARIDIYSVYSSIEEAKIKAENILVDLGLSESKAERYVDKVVKESGKYKDSVDINFNGMKIEGNYFENKMWYDVIMN
jgi:hypothetical protein